MDAESRKNLDEMERSQGKPSGIGRIERGECPMGAVNAVGCMFCSYGHMTECHHPFTCDEADCQHG